MLWTKPIIFFLLRYAKALTTTVCGINVLIGVIKVWRLFKLLLSLND